MLWSNTKAFGNKDFLIVSHPTMKIHVIPNLNPRRKFFKKAGSYLPRSSASCRAASTDIPDPLSPLLPIIHRFWQVIKVTSCVLA